MAGPAPEDDLYDKPLDPAAERLRRRLVRFMGINLAILFAAVMAVVLAVVYKSMSPQPGDVLIGERPTASRMLSGDIPIPAGAEVLSHAVSGTRLTLHLRAPGGGETILVHDMATGQPVGRFAITREAP